MMLLKSVHSLAFMMIEYFANKEGVSIEESVILKEKSNQFVYLDEYIIILNLN